MKSASRLTPAPSLWALVDAEQSAMDQLLASLRMGIRDQRHFDELEAEADAIGKRLRAAFRSAR